MRCNGRVLLALVGTLAATPAAAQSGGTIELGVFGRFTKFSDSLGVDVVNRLPAENGFGGGLRLGIFVMKNLELEATASYLEVDAAGGGRVNHIPIHAGFTYNFPIGGKSAFLLGARYVRNMYGEDADFSDNGIGGVAGFRFGPLRVEGLFDYMPKDDPNHGSYRNLGVNAGLSLLLGGCNKSTDAVTVSPSTATVDRGAQTTFTATATRCGKPAEVTWTATGGTITSGGEYTAGQNPGTFSVTATEPKGGLTSSATVTIRTPPPPVTLSRIELTPERANVRMSESVTFQVNGIYSDGSTRALTNCTFTTTGNPTQSGMAFTWTQAGSYTVTVQCEGMTDTANVEVRLEMIIFGANFAFDRAELTSSGLDTVRVAADSLKKYPDVRVRLGGHADFMGSDEYNCDLSWRRVRTVQNALRQFGISDDRIILVEAYGEAQPIPDDRVPQEWRDINTRTRDKGKWWDRRVEITSETKPAAMMACTPATGR
jgi:OOP family OmpA-OmpF porin